MSWRAEAERLRQASGYVSGISAREASRIAGRRRFVNLQSNENLFVPSRIMEGLVRRALKDLDLRLYPKEVIEDLRNLIAEKEGLSADNVLLGHGADQLIELILRAFGKDRSLLIHSPTYSYYQAAGIGILRKVIEVEFEDNERLNLRAIERENPDLVFICSPNNPTGGLVPEEDLKELLSFYRGLVVIDETYAQIAGITYRDLIKSHDNVIILRTFSKAFAMASFRIGYAMADRTIMEALSRIQSPFPVASLSAKVAYLALKREAYFKGIWRKAIETRTWFEGRLSSKVRRTRSFTYFLTISTERSSEEVFMALLKRGYITRIIKPFRGFENPVRLNVAPKSLIRDLPDAINELV
ncbi:MAG: pyridoxal phosphate-dependent aminotransferase [Nitrososphaeria archaeon]